MTPIISVIIPVYNVEKYLKGCVESVLAQSFQDFEIILVDDGSTDKSGIICDSLSERDKRIKIIHQPNSGLSHTRNIGTEAACGKFVTYIDSDDTVHFDYLKVLSSLTEEYEADVSSCEFIFCKEGEEPEYLDKEYKTGVLSGKEALKQMLRGEIHSTSACGLLIRKDIAAKNKFPVGKYHEDDLTTYKYYIESRSVAYTKQPLYTYYQRKGSIMHKPFSQIDIDELDAADQVYSDCSCLGIEYEKAALVKKTYNYCQILFKFPDLRETDVLTFNRINAFVSSNLIEIMKDPNIGRNIKIKLLLYKLKLLNPVRKILRKEV